MDTAEINIFATMNVLLDHQFGLQHVLISIPNDPENTNLSLVLRSEISSPATKPHLDKNRNNKYKHTTHKIKIHHPANMCKT